MFNSAYKLNHIYLLQKCIDLNPESTRAVVCSVVLNRFRVIGVHRTDLFSFCRSGDLNTGCTYDWFLPPPQGIYVTRVTPQGPAEKAGLMMGDKIMQACIPICFIRFFLHIHKMALYVHFTGRFFQNHIFNSYILHICLLKKVAWAFWEFSKSESTFK